MNNDPGSDPDLPCAHMLEVLNAEQTHRVYMELDDGDCKVPAEDLLRLAAECTWDG